MKEVMQFLAQLAANNNKEWMDAHKQAYQDARKRFIEVVDQLLVGMSGFEPRMSELKAKDCIFRINRDIRFSNNKSPYKNNFGAYFAPGGKNVVAPGYYIHIQPGQSFFGGGIYMPDGETIKKIRQEIDYNPDELLNLLQQPEFHEWFGSLTGEQLKTAPKGYPADHPNIHLLRMKSFIAMKSLTDAQVTGERLVETVVRGFQVMKPLNDYLTVSVS